MTGLTRRALLGGAAGVTGLAMTPHALAGPVPKLHVFDSRLGGPRRPAIAHHDIVGEDATFWRASRALALRPGNHVSGVTRWSDWVALRGLFGERGLRTRSLLVAGNIATWEMA
jgi:hypothetical protein